MVDYLDVKKIQRREKEPIKNPYMGSHNKDSYTVPINYYIKDSYTVPINLIILF